jgi:negative regulator of flagellin synthesis FlgM
MKVDLNGSTAPPALETGVKASGTGSAAPALQADKSLAQDRTTFQSSAQTVSSLTKQAMSTPEVRQDKIDALRQAMDSGTFKFDANKAAEAMIKDSM